MNNTPINRVVILGGGSAGWMCAAALAKFLGRKITITLIESEDIPTIGVGEASIPPIRGFNNLLEIPEDEFLAATQGTFKLGIQFEDWGNIGDKYLHTFDYIGYERAPAKFHHYWLKAKSLGNKSDYWDYSLNKQAADAKRFTPLSGNPQTQLEYAYHFDAELYARKLRQLSESLGVTRIAATVIQVSTHPISGYIESLELSTGEFVNGDLFIDCSGFRGLLIEQTLKTGYEDWNHWLPCDSAIAVQSQLLTPIPPFTRSTANSAGWQWQIPLQNRTGNGIVYASCFMNDDQALAELVSNLNSEPLTKTKFIKFKTGRRLKQWNKNCIALGLASGFLEPLESTSLHLIQTGIIRLLKLFPQGAINQVEVDEYNRQAQIEFELIRDFIILHYKQTARDDSDFWQYCKNMSVPESLAHKLELFAANGRIFREQNELFQEGSWCQVMLGQGLIPRGYDPVVDMMSDAELDKLLFVLQNEISQSVKRFQSHSEFLAKFCPTGK